MLRNLGTKSEYWIIRNPGWKIRPRSAFVQHTSEGLVGSSLSSFPDSAAIFDRYFLFVGLVSILLHSSVASSFNLFYFRKVYMCPLLGYFLFYDRLPPGGRSSFLILTWIIKVKSESKPKVINLKVKSESNPKVKLFVLTVSLTTCFWNDFLIMY